MKGLTNVGSGKGEFDASYAVLQIKSAAGSMISIFDESDNVIVSLGASMGIADAAHDGLAYYYCAIAPQNFGTLMIKIAYNDYNIYGLEVNITTNKFYSFSSTDFTRCEILKLYDNGHFHRIVGSSQTPLLMLKGTETFQTDNIDTYSTSFEYFERDNDYGGFVTENPIAFSGYGTLRIVIDNISSWQDNNFKAGVYLLTSKPASVGTSGISSYAYREYINSGGNSGVHIVDYGPKEIAITLTSYQATYYIAITTASGRSVDIDPANIKISKIQLEPASV